MSIIDKVAGKIFGSKSERDLRELQPYVEKINEQTAKVEKLTNDELRMASLELKQEIRGSVEEEQKEIDELQELRKGAKGKARDETEMRVFVPEDISGVD